MGGIRVAQFVKLENGQPLTQLRMKARHATTLLWVLLVLTTTGPSADRR